jgi:hypothetical protein
LLRHQAVISKDVRQHGIREIHAGKFFYLLTGGLCPILAMKRVIVTLPMVGIAGMQVCAVASATDQEILEVCNAENPAGTSKGWSQVLRDPADSQAPVVCASHPDRMHFIVYC